MKNFSIKKIALLVILNLSFANFAQAYTSIRAFGDSLSDTGNICGPCGSNLELEIVDFDSSFCNLYPNGFTDGLLWTQRLAEYVGHTEFRPSDHGGHNFAVGGATSNGLASQIDACLAREPQIDSSTLVVLWIGGNDVKNYFKNHLSPPKSGDGELTRIILKDLKKNIRKLTESGAKSFLIPNLPPLDQAPLVKILLSMQSFFAPLSTTGPKGALTLTERIQMTIRHYNTEQHKLLARLRVELNIEIHEMDTFELFSEALKESTENLFFTDGFHPSQYAHELLARKAIEIIDTYNK